MEPVSRGKNVARQLVQKIARGQGCRVPIDEKAEVIK